MGHELARSIGYNIVKPVPSLFKFDAKDLVKDGGIFNGLSGVLVPLARMTLVVSDEMTGQSSDTKPANVESTAPKNKNK